MTREDLKEYAQDYYPHVQAFPTYLAEFGVRLHDGELRRAVLANLCDEKGGEDVLDLYCGVGLFTHPISLQARKVLFSDFHVEYIPIVKVQGLIGRTHSETSH